jgi:hypothetical protein
LRQSHDFKKAGPKVRLQSAKSRSQVSVLSSRKDASVYSNASKSNATKRAIVEKLDNLSEAQLEQLKRTLGI